MRIFSILDNKMTDPTAPQFLAEGDAIVVSGAFGVGPNTDVHELHPSQPADLRLRVSGPGDGTPGQMREEHR